MVKRQHRANQWPYCRNKLSIYRNVRCVMFRIYLRPALIIYVWQHLKKSNKSMHKSNITEIYYNFFSTKTKYRMGSFFLITNIFIKNEIIVIVFSFIKKICGTNQKYLMNFFHLHFKGTFLYLYDIYYVLYTSYFVLISFLYI